MEIPQELINKLYVIGSMENTPDGVKFAIKNDLSESVLTGVKSILVDGVPVDIRTVTVHIGENVHRAESINPDTPVKFARKQFAHVHLIGKEFRINTEYHLRATFEAGSFGIITIDLKDTMTPKDETTVKIPRALDNSSNEIVIMRHNFIKNRTGRCLTETYKGIDPSLTKNNIENYIGCAKVPIGIAGPLKINGQNAIGDFLVPLATTEGTLVASYNRGMKIIDLCGGIRTTIHSRAMQRAPVFIFSSARDTGDFIKWLFDNHSNIEREAQKGSKHCLLINIEKYVVGKMVFTRFNYDTDDAAGQNMVTKATFDATNYILENYKGISNFYLESNISADKKPSHINILHTRGYRVTAELTIPKDIVTKHLHTEVDKIRMHGNVGSIGAFLAGTLNNGLHSANGITAMFIATGQDVASLAESCMGIVYNEVTPEGDIYGSLTIPSLICGTVGGGTHLPTQREALELMDCYGHGKAPKLAEIIAATAFAGEISLVSAISSMDWVRSHEQMGRNRI